MSDYMTVFGCTPQKHTRTDWKEYWDLVYDTDDQMLFISKELYKYDFPEENRIFNYNMVLELQIVETDDENILTSVLYLVPTMQYIHNSIKEEVMKSYCCKEEDIYLIDLLYEYQFPILAQETPCFELKIFDENNDEMSKWLLSASIASEVIGTMLGFSLDKVVNRIGTTNWDLLDGALFGIDPFKQSLDRINKQMEGNEK